MKEEIVNFSDYSSVIQWLFRQLPMYQRDGKSAFKKNLNNITALCKALGNPQNNYKTIHLAGTNGKGTTGHIIAAGLAIAGLKVGLYTSPHYIDYRERMKINGVMMKKSFVLSFMESNFEIIKEIKPSFFEITVAMAFQYFYEEKVDIAVIETGLGGRLDSTNIILPILSIITNISLDHESMLGHTIKEIAIEKAGIIKPQIPVIIGEKQRESDAVFIRKAKEEQAEILFVQDHLHIHKKSNTLPHTHYDIIYNKSTIHCVTDLIGDYQAYNIATALFSLNYISKKNLVADFKWDLYHHKEILLNLYQTWKYMGRFQLLSDKPMIIADSAHNIAGLKSVLSSLGNYTFDTIHFVIGFVNDKTLDKILPLFDAKSSYYFVNANIPRALNSIDLQKMGSDYGLLGNAYDSVIDGVEAAKINAKENDLIYIGGSIFVIGAYLARKSNKK